MLRRQSAKSRSELGRRKSTSSVHGVHLEYIDPAVAQRDAQIAACQAYTRAQERDKTDMPLFPPTPESSPRRRQFGSSSRARDDLTTPRREAEGGPDLRRRQSVRFMGPCSVHGRTSQGLEPDSTQLPKETESSSVLKQDDFDTVSSRRYILENNDTPQRAYPINMPRRKPPPVPLPGIATNYLDAMVAQEEYYTPEDNIASAPSSFRRLRRSRSMFTSDETGAGTSQDRSLLYSNGRHQGSRLPHISSTRRVLHTDPCENAPMRDVPQLRAPKSMSFLKNRNTRSGSITTQDGNDREPGYLMAADPPGHRPSGTFRGTPRLVSKASFFSSRNRRTEHGIRKSLRSSSSAEDQNTPSAPPPVPSGKEERFKVKARKVSKSLKTKLKSFFNLTKSEEEPPSFPQQHITAQRTHVHEGFMSPMSSHNDQDDRSEIDWSSLHRVPSKVPSLQTVPKNLVHSDRGSLDSLKSPGERKVSDDRSLTSWAASGPSTLTSQQQQEWKEWERQRLSIIKENGTHAPTPSVHRRALGTYTFQGHDHSVGNLVPEGPIVDSQRVYSALMKRVNESNNQTNAILDHQRGSRGIFSGLLNKMPSMESLRQVSMKTTGTENRIPSNYYHSTSPDDLATPTRASKKGGLRFGRQGTYTGQCKSDIPAPMNAFHGEAVPTGQDERNPVEDFDGEESSHDLATNPTSGSDLQDPFIDDNRSSFQAIGHPNQCNGFESLSVNDSSSLCTPTAHLFRTKPPYRQALRRSMEAVQNENQHQTCAPVGQAFKNHDTPIQHSGTSNHGQRIESEPSNEPEYSESMYSTDEYNHNQGQYEQRMDRRNNPEGLADNLHGDVGSPDTYRPAGYRDGSSGSSIDWKTWLSANVAKFESSPTPPRLSEVEYALPTMPKSFPGGHIRESAQTHDDDDDDEGGEVFEPPTHHPTLPTSPLAMVQPNVVKVSPLQRSIKRSTPPSAGRTLLENDSPLGTPPIPIKNALRTAHSPLKHKESNVYSLPSSVASSPGLSLAFQRQFGFVPKHSDASNSKIQRRGSSDGDGNDKYSNYGGRTRRLSREGKDIIAEHVQYSGQQGVGNHDESAAFI